MKDHLHKDTSIKWTP